jgi:hypothetical protein
MKALALVPTIGLGLLSTLGCSDPPSPPPQGAISVFLGDPTSGQGSCPTNTGEISVPARNGNEDPTYNALNCDLSTGCKPDESVVVDKDQNAEVQCSVQSVGTDQFNVNFQLTKPASSTSGGTVFSGSTTSGPITSSGGTMRISQFVNPPGATFSQDNCTVEITPSTLQFPNGVVKPGAIWAHFSCDTMQMQDAAGNQQCSATGAFIFENCSK